jgi:hypothetical protein
MIQLESLTRLRQVIGVRKKVKYGHTFTGESDFPDSISRCDWNLCRRHHMKTDKRKFLFSFEARGSFTGTAILMLL